MAPPSRRFNGHADDASLFGGGDRETRECRTGGRLSYAMRASDADENDAKARTLPRMLFRYLPDSKRLAPF